MSSPAAACWTKRVMPTTEACARCAEPKASQTNTPSQRSEEHTSELQSRLHLVCRLLLEKKNTILHPRLPVTYIAPAWSCLTSLDRVTPSIRSHMFTRRAEAFSTEPQTHSHPPVIPNYIA